MSEAQTKYISTADMPKEEWLKKRKEGIGASEIGAVLGLNKYKTPYDVWLDKTSRDIIEIIETPAMRRGTRMEEIVAEEYVAYSGNQVRRDNKMRIHPTHKFLFASLDRIILDKGDSRGVGVLECKTVSFQTKKAWEDEIPLYYYAQLQQQLAVTGYTWGEIALLVADTFDLTVLPFQRDDEFIASMEQAAYEFWNTNVLQKIPPPMQVADFEAVYTKDERKVVATEDIIKIVGRSGDLKEQIKSLKEQKDSADEAIKIFMGEKTHLICEDKVIATWKTIEKKGYEVKPTSYRSLIIKS